MIKNTDLLCFGRGELENIFGEVQIKPEILDKRLDHLMKTVKIPVQMVKMVYADRTF